MRRRPRWRWALGLLLVAPSVADAQDICPLPPNPNYFPCPLAVNRSTLTEQDLDADGNPDNSGSVGGFCAGDSPADCVGFATAEVGFNLVVPNPALQSVTCSAPGLDVWIMSDGCDGCLVRGFGSVTLPAGTTTDSTLRVVTADVNGDVCPCGPLLTCTYSRETFCADGADGDADGLIDADDPDCCPDADGDGYCGAADCDDGNPFVFQPPGELQTLTATPLPNVLRLEWVAGSVEVVDVATGLLSDAVADGDLLSAWCLVDDQTGSSFTDMRRDPDPGQAYFYLARRQNSCGAGTYGPGTSRALLDGSGPCPP